MRDSSPDDFDELEPMDEELLEAFDVIDTVAFHGHSSVFCSDCSKL
jgi:hypothetical protein